MAERVHQPPPPIYANQSHGPQLQLPNLSSGTYIVQVPRDQVYRVPPPENACIAEHHRHSPERATKWRRCWCCARIIAYIAVVIIIGSLLGGFFFMLNRPKDPRFSIQRFLLIHRKPHPKYNLTLQVHNPNSLVGILYKRWDLSLSTRQREIASGAYPTFYQGHHRSTVLSLALKASKTELPKEVHESITNDRNKVHVTFSLTIHVAARLKMGKLHSGTKKYDVTCQMMVDTLAKATRVLSQRCQTKRH